METIRRGTPKKDSVITLQSFLQALGFMIVVDGDFGPITDGLVRDFQLKNRLVADGIVGPKTWHKLHTLKPDLVAQIAQRFLSENDLQAAAQRLGLELALVKAVNEIESGGTGFINDKPKILFEGHVFWRRLVAHGLDPEDFNRANKDILFERPDITSYKGGLEEYKRMDRAKLIHETAAMESASWGSFQIMGYHWKRLGYDSVFHFVQKMHENEGAHMDAFARFLETFKLVDHLRNHDWSAFARLYNGEGHRNYDKKIADAYHRYKALEAQQMAGGNPEQGTPGQGGLIT